MLGGIIYVIKLFLGKVLWIRKHINLCLMSCYASLLFSLTVCVLHSNELFFSVPCIFKKVDEEPNRNYFGLRYMIPEHLNAFWELIRSLTMGYTHGPEYKEGWLSIFVRIIGLVLPGVAAHCPTDYVNSVRLGKERAIQMSSF